MKWLEGRIINRISMPITRFCNRQCPDCGIRRTLTWYDKANWEKKDVSVDELRRVGELLGPLELIEINGGEPTLHPAFEEISLNLHNIFQANRFMLVTNGIIARKPERLSLLLKYDSVYVSHYTKEFAEFYKVNEPNTADVRVIRDFLKPHPEIEFWIQGWKRHIPYPEQHEPYDGPVICGQWQSPLLSYYDGNLYGCCVAYGLKNPGVTIPLTKDWRDHVTKLTTPCETCFSARGIPLWTLDDNASV